MLFHVLQVKIVLENAVLESVSCTPNSCMEHYIIPSPSLMADLLMVVSLIFFGSINRRIMERKCPKIY